MKTDYNSEIVARPTSSEIEFVTTADKYHEYFTDNLLFTKVNNGSFSLQDYHQLLCNLFYQVYYSSSSFALAAANCGWDQKHTRDYLIAHAEEEKYHWQWILEDLKTSGYTKDPRSEFPSYKATAYYSYAHFLANSKPILRLAMAYYLEGLSAKFGKSFATKACSVIKITPDKASFFVKHGDLDGGHSEEVLEVIVKNQNSPLVWGEMVQTLKCTAYLYRELYNI